MTQEAVERALGKLVTDEGFRAHFFVAPIEACREAGLILSAFELDALNRLSPDELGRFGREVDPRISRPCLDPTSVETRGDA